MDKEDHPRRTLFRPLLYNVVDLCARVGIGMVRKSTSGGGCGNTTVRTSTSSTATMISTSSTMVVVVVVLLRHWKWYRYKLRWIPVGVIPMRDRTGQNYWLSFSVF